MVDRNEPPSLPMAAARASDPVQTMRAAEMGLVGPHDPNAGTRATVAAVWADALRRPHVSENDDFFESGGQSLDATVVVAKLRKIFGLRFPVRMLFENPTVRELAVAIDRERAKETEAMGK